MRDFVVGVSISLTGYTFNTCGRLHSSFGLQKRGPQDDGKE